MTIIWSIVLIASVISGVTFAQTALLAASAPQQAAGAAMAAAGAIVPYVFARACEAIFVKRS